LKQKKTFPNVFMAQFRAEYLEFQPVLIKSFLDHALKRQLKQIAKKKRHSSAKDIGEFASNIRLIIARSLAK